MAAEPVSSGSPRGDRVPPYSEEAERGVLGSVLLDAQRVMDLCVQAQLNEESFHVTANRSLYGALLAMYEAGRVIDVLTVAECLKTNKTFERIGGGAYLDALIDGTPTAAHAEYYIDLVRQKDLLRRIISVARSTEQECFEAQDGADLVLGRAEQALLSITERQHGEQISWGDAIKTTMQHVERILDTHRGLTGLSSGFANLDRIIHGLRPGEMTVLAARPSMGKTSLAMNIAENIALGVRDPDQKGHGVGIFSLEMSCESLIMRMLCAHAEISGSALAKGMVEAGPAHGKLASAASVLMKAPIFLDDTGGLDILELRARARRMKTRNNIELLVVDYLQLLQSREYSRQGKQVEVAHVSNNIKAMAKELKIPVLVLSQLSRAPEQRDKLGKPKLSDLRDSGAIEQDADVVLLLRRPCKYPDDPDHDDQLLAVVDVAKHRNGPTGEVVLNFEQEFTRFRDREHGTDGYEELEDFDADMEGIEA